ncbi:hypothetical protein [Croceiramulus getboli]|nr:hypothetical protein P8624_06605 [Flavobacteriaceae bacterium YJPT1-3]
MKKGIQNIPEPLRKRRGVRALITLYFGLIPLGFGIFGMYSLLDQNVYTYEGIDYTMQYETECGKNIKSEHCLTVFLNTARLGALLSNKELDRLLISANHLASEKYGSVKQGVAALNSNQLPISLEHNGQMIREMSINGEEIIKPKYGFLWAALFILIGLIWIGGHIWFIKTDPYEVYGKSSKLN